MFCQFCGSPIDATATVCPKCGKAQTRAGGGAKAGAGGNAGEQVGAAAKDAVTAFLATIVNPVGGLAPAYTSLGANRALGAGIALSVLFALIVALSLVLFEGRGAFSFMFTLAFYAESKFGMFIRGFIGLLVLPAAMMGVSYGIRKVLSGDGPFGADAFTVGAALTPFGLAMFLSNALGAMNAEINLILMLFGIAYAVLILYAGFTRLGGLTEKSAAPAVPLAFGISMWICTVVFRALA